MQSVGRMHITKSCTGGYKLSTIFIVGVHVTENGVMLL